MLIYLISLLATFLFIRVRFHLMRRVPVFLDISASSMICAGRLMIRNSCRRPLMAQWGTVTLKILHNSVAKWGLGTWHIQELPLLAAIFGISNLWPNFRQEMKQISMWEDFRANVLQRRKESKGKERNKTNWNQQSNAKQINWAETKQASLTFCKQYL